jgi:hypothetical protein
MNQTHTTGELDMNHTTSICMWTHHPSKYGTARSGSTNQITARKMAECATVKTHRAVGITNYEQHTEKTREQGGIHQPECV